MQLAFRPSVKMNTSGHHSWVNPITRHRIEATFKDGEKDGLYQEWYEDGTLCVKCSYKNGVLDGLYERWSSMGNVEEVCGYKAGELHGLYRRWNWDGTLLERRVFNEGIEMRRRARHAVL